MAAILLVLVALAPQLRELPEDRITASVGVPVEVRELLLPGPELEVRPGDFETPLVLRIVDAFPHGDAFRYDLEWYGLDPGDYDLRDFLQRADGSPVGDLPPLSVHVTSLLPPGRTEPHALAPASPPRVGGYSVLLWTLGALWAVGLVLILRLRRRASAGEPGDESARPRTLADRLRPLVQDAARGSLSRARTAELEMLLIAFWRRRLGLHEANANDALRALKEHAEAGPLLRSLEDWLHRPDPPAGVDVAELLAPYRDLPADALDVPAAMGVG